MATNPSSPAYPLGSTQAEYQRLARQAAIYAPFTERVFRGAGIGPGLRVLDIGSGAADVSLLVAEIVGPSGEVVGVERNPESVAHARARVEQAGLNNVSFIQSDAANISTDKSFDAAVGRLILEFVPDPVAVVRSAARLVKRGGVVIFLEPSWKTLLKLSEHLPLWFQSLTTIHETLLRAGAHPDIGLDLHRIFQAAGLVAPTMELDTILSCEPNVTSWASDILHSMVPQIREAGISLEPLGDLDTLAERHHEEIKHANTVVAMTPLVGAVSTR